MAEVIAGGNIILTDLNDNKQLQMFIGSSQPKTQIYDVNNEKYSPDWSVNKPVLTPQLFVAGTNTDLIDSVKSIKWYDENDEIPLDNENYTIDSNGKTLTINRSVLSKNEWYAVRYEDYGGHYIPKLEDLEMLVKKEERIFVDANRMSFSSDEAKNNQYTAHFHTYVYVSSDRTITLNGRVDDDINIYINGVSQFEKIGSADFNTGAMPLKKGWNRFDLLYHEVLGGDFIALNTKLSDLVDGMSYGKSINRTKTISCEVIYTDPDTGFDIVSEASIDLSLIQTGSKGDKGQVGDNAIIAVLNNDYQTIYTDKDGNNGNYSGAVSTITIYSGSKDDTSNWSISASTSNATGVLSGNTYTVTNLTADTGYVTFTATRSGYTTITKQFRLSKSKIGSTGNTGSTGSSATEYWLVTDVNVLQRNSSSYYPVSITVSGKYQYGSGTPTAYAGRFVISESYDGTSYSVVSSSTANESTRVYTPSNQTIKIVKVQLYLAGGTSTLLDEQTIPIVEDGISGQSGDNAKNLVVWTPEGDTIKNGENKVVAQADLYNGSDVIEGTNYRWYRENPNASSEGGEGWEELDNGKRNLIAKSDFILEVTKDKFADSIPTPFYLADGSNLNRFIGKTLVFSYYVHSMGDWQSGSGTLGGRFGIHSSIIWKDSTGVKSSYTEYPFADYLTTSVDNKRVSMTYKALPPSGYDTIYSFTFSFQPHAKPASTNDEIWKIGQPKLEYDYKTIYIPAPEDVEIDENDSNMYGRNLLLGMEGMSGVHTYRNGASNEYGILQSDGFYRYSLNPSGGKIAEILADKFYDVVVGKTYTKSLLYKTDSTDLSFGFTFFTNEHHPRSVTTINMGNGVKKVYATWVADYPRLRAPDINGFSFTNGTYIDIKDVKLEEGSVLTDWTPAPEDNSSLYPTVANGLNSWIFEKYAGARTTLTYSMLKEITANGIKTILSDSTDIVKTTGNDYTGYLRTAVYVSQDKSIDLKFTHDDGCRIYINSIPVYYKSSYTSGATFTLQFKKGWNNLEFIWFQGTGGDGINTIISGSISSLVDEMNCYYALPYGQLRGIDGVEGYNTKSITVSKDAVINVENFKCVVERGGKNIVPTDANMWEVGTFDSWGKDGDASNRIRTVDKIKITKGEAYTISCADGFQILANNGTTNTSWGNTLTFVANSDTTRLVVKKTDESTMNPSEIKYIYPQLEEGSTKTAFEEHGVYEDQITIQDVTDPYAVTIIGANTFKNGEGQNTFTAKVFQNGTEVDADGNQFTYKWYLYNQDDIVDTTWNGVGYKEGKTITINATDVAYQGRVICEVDG